MYSLPIEGKLPMKTFIVLPLILLAGLAGCATLTPTDTATLSAEVYRQSFVPIDPVPTFFSEHFDSAGRWVSTPWVNLDNEHIRKSLPNQSAGIIMQKLELGGKISYLSANISRDEGSYWVILDYMKYQVTSIWDSLNHLIGYGRVGVGLRMTATVRTEKSNLDLGSIIAIGVAAQQGYLKGSLQVDVVGMDSPEITNLFPTPSTIDETSIGKALEAIAAIKSKLSDAGTTLTPQLVAIRVVSVKATPDDIRQNVH